MRFVSTISIVWLPVLFNEDNYNMKNKNAAFQFLPIIAVIASWIDILLFITIYPCGLYILMMGTILKSFIKIMFIWFSTLLCFASLFQLVTHKSKMGVWKDVSLQDNLSI